MAMNFHNLKSCLLQIGIKHLGCYESIYATSNDSIRRKNEKFLNQFVSG